jgi:hypothetical protein
MKKVNAKVKKIMNTSFTIAKEYNDINQKASSYSKEQMKPIIDDYIQKVNIVQSF